MDCRQGCGACCIAPSIRQPFFGMPDGKPAGVRCAHLSDSLCCLLFEDSRRPAACSAFQPELLFCGETREEALQILSGLEQDTQPEAT